jgi:SAM-dependent methyltransferase
MARLNSEIRAGLDHKTVRDYYDRVYYKEAGVERTALNHYCRLGRRFIPWQGKRLLDVACGTGGWLQAAAALGACPTGVDISPVALEACRRSLPQAELHCGPAEQLPFNDREFDFISCLGALEHFLSPEAALLEMIRVAKPNAGFLLLVPNSGFLLRRVGLYCGTEQAGVREEVRSLQGWQELFESIGLTVQSRWKDLHVLSPSWILRGSWHLRPVRLAQALALPCWPLSWQYQVYHFCRVKE